MIIQPDRSIVVPPPLAMAKFLLTGKINYEHWRDGKLILRDTAPNGIVNVGKNYILDVMFNSQTQIANSAWCIGIINNAGTPTLAPTDIMSSHAWTEFTTYSQATRVPWSSAAASSQQTTNPSAATFDITGTATLFGIFVNSANDKVPGTSGILWTTAAFASTIPVTSGDQIKVSYAVAC